MDITKTIDSLIDDYCPQMFLRNEGFYSSQTLWTDLKISLLQFLRGYYEAGKIAVYPGGMLGRDIVDLLKGSELCPSFVIDNNTQIHSYNEIPVLSYKEWAMDNLGENGMVIVASTNLSDAFKQELLLDDYSGIIVDVWEWMTKTYKNLEYPPSFYRETGFWTYNRINHFWELYENETDSDEKSRYLQCLIYGLLRIRDFYSAEFFINRFNNDREFVKYNSLMRRIREVLLEAVCLSEQRNSLVIHIIDSLSDPLVDRMEWLREYARKGFRLKGVTSLYPTTHYAINTVFTGKETFEIELFGDKVRADDSDLLEYLLKETSFSMISVNRHINQEFCDVNSFDNSSDLIDAPLSAVLFAGLAALVENDKRKTIVMHSVGEVHDPFYCVGYKCVHPRELMNRESIAKQRKASLAYADNVLKWYMELFERTSCTSIVMGDHGIHDDSTYYYYHGLKKDYSVFNLDEINPAFIVFGEKFSRVEHCDLIPQTNIHKVLLEIMKKDNIQNIEDYTSDYVLLEGIPRYSKLSVELLIPRRVWGLYEGLIGVRTKECIYLRYSSGKEVFYVPNKHEYRNLVDDPLYQNDLNECKSLLGDRCFPIRIYRMDKFKDHLDAVKKYDILSYEYIMSGMQSDL